MSVPNWAQVSELVEESISKILLEDCAVVEDFGTGVLSRRNIEVETRVEMRCKVFEGEVI
jgi:hypothetical protein